MVSRQRNGQWADGHRRGRCSAMSTAASLLRGLVIVVLIFGSGCQNVDDSAEECFTPENKPGNCIVLMSCEPLHSELMAASVSERAAVQRKLLRYNCGYEKTMPKVCCPLVTLVTQPPVTSRPVTSRPVAATRPPTVLGPPDVSGHRNLGLLAPLDDCGSLTENRILGGNKTDIYEFPWMVLISYRKTRGTLAFKCGGSVINTRYVLTAAHCITGLRADETLAGVRIGEHDTRTVMDCTGPVNRRYCAPPVQDIAIEQAIAHPGYSRELLQDDIGLIRVAIPIEYNDNVAPICLPSTREISLIPENESALVTGWGATETGAASPVLLKVSLPMVNNSVCNNIFKALPNGIIHKQLCAGGIENVDSCGGDSGGPMKFGRFVGATIRYVQYGVVSFGPMKCGSPGIPGVYTYVSYYMDWILDQLKP